MDFENGGRETIERLVQAYGFSTRQALSEHLGVSKSTVATRVMRDVFPADWVIRAALETGVSLRWLSTGEGAMYEDSKYDLLEIKRQKLIDGKLYDSNFYMFDKALLPGNLQDPKAILDGETVYLVDCSARELSNGKWLIEVEGETSIKDLTRIPVGRVRVSSNGDSFECGVEDINILAKVAMTCSK
ncbi:phage repressor protein CI [Serratia marcescens]|uniref:phage repressor protein CI n=1 Tax=Serratia marcescens TaxID=615 RepID=UPI0009271FE1|nr:phage repressor protein CI [Serratia marcescens]OJH81801.1 CI family repressor [Serratia marcescens]